MPSPLIEIPPDDIFKNDRLGLETAIQGRTQALLERSPQAIAIDGRWGTGKSTFLALWDAYLRREGVKVVRFNAWKSSGADPFDALTREILRQVEVPAPEQKVPHKQLAWLIARRANLAAMGVKLVSILQPDYAEVSQAAAAGIQSAANALVSETDELPDPKIESPDDIASLLSCAAKAWSDRPVVVMVDELDRCSPEYAVEFLQLLEHVFHAEHVVFVVAINRPELQHSIKSFYGQGFNAEGYLERFFDDIFGLPTSRRSEYIKTSVELKISSNVSNALLFLEASDLSLREIDKAVQVLGSVAENRPKSAYTLVNLWIARTLAPDPFRQFLSGSISDKELVDAVISNGSCERLRVEHPTYELRGPQELEVVLILCSAMFSKGSLWHFCENLATGSELIRHYQDIVCKGEVGKVSIPYAKGVLDLASARSGDITGEEYVGEIIRCARLLERESPPE